MSAPILAVPGVLGNVKPLQPQIVMGERIWLWVDAGVASTPDDWIMPELRDRGLTPPERNIVVVTHGDVDHFGGVGRLQELIPSLVVVAGVEDAALMSSVETMMDVRYDAFGGDGVELPDWRRAQLLERGGGPIRPSILVRDSIEIDVDGERWHVLSAPGHSDGHLVVWQPDAGILIGGDVVMGWGVVDGDGNLQPPHYIDVDDYLETISRLRGLGIVELRLAHEPVLRGAAAERFLDDSEAAVHELDRAISDALARQVSSGSGGLLEICEDVRGRTSRWPEALPSAFAPSVHAHLERGSR
jgi:glyoxylase-like metal-dependent hydrolase (beta-lactamase superfamily II)